MSDGVPQDVERVEAYLKSFEELLLFCKEFPEKYSEIQRMVDEFYEKYLDDILADYARQFAFTLVNLKVYSVFRGYAVDAIPRDEVGTEIDRASLLPARRVGSLRRERSGERGEHGSQGTD